MYVFSPIGRYRFLGGLQNQSSDEIIKLYVKEKSLICRNLLCNVWTLE